MPPAPAPPPVPALPAQPPMPELEVDWEDCEDEEEPPPPVEVVEAAPPPPLSEEAPPLLASGPDVTGSRASEPQAANARDASKEPSTIRRRVGRIASAYGVTGDP